MTLLINFIESLHKLMNILWFMYYCIYENSWYNVTAKKELVREELHFNSISYSEKSENVLAVGTHV